MYKENDPQFWENIYLEDDAGWDLEGATPVFKHFSETQKKGSVCIVGCGRGYDAVQFAKKDFQVTAVDFAPTAIADVKKLALNTSVEVTTIQDDIFSLSYSYANAFDYLIEQTCFCAIHPSRRKEYETMAKTILKTKGKLIGLWFPLDKTLEEGGPAWGTTAHEVKSIFSSGWKIIEEKFPELSIEPRRGREKLIIFQKS